MREIWGKKAIRGTLPTLVLARSTCLGSIWFGIIVIVIIIGGVVLSRIAHFVGGDRGNEFLSADFPAEDFVGDGMTGNFFSHRELFSPFFSQW